MKTIGAGIFTKMKPVGPMAFEEKTPIDSTLPETNIFAPENGWLEDDPFLWGRLGPIFRCELAVSFREGRF